MKRAAIVIAAVIALGAPARAGHARLQPGIVVTANQTVTRSFPAIVGANPVAKEHVDDVNLPPEPDPPTCTNLPTCDEIPLTVRRPSGFTVFDTFTFRVELRWEGASDLDLYLWQEPPGPTPTRRAKTSAQPEVIAYPAGDRQNYHLVINNAAGVNRGYTVKVTALYARGERPFDVTTPSFDSPLVTAPTLPEALPTNLPAAATTTSIAPGDLIDPDLGNLSAAGPAPDIFRDAEAAVGPPKPVTGATVFWWAIVLPLVVASACGGVFYRRRPRALSFRRAPASRR